MRYLARDVIKEPSAIASWWEEWPARTRRFWSLLLFDKGQGWLRWGTDTRTGWDNVGEGLDQPYDYIVAPPLRRVAWYLKEWLVGVPYLMLIGVDLFDEVEVAPAAAHKRYRYTWEEARPDWDTISTWYIDEDRYQELWGMPKSWTKRKRR